MKILQLLNLDSTVNSWMLTIRGKNWKYLLVRCLVQWKYVQHNIQKVQSLYTNKINVTPAFFLPQPVHCTIMVWQNMLNTSTTFPLPHFKNQTYSNSSFRMWYAAAQDHLMQKMPKKRELHGKQLITSTYMLHSWQIKLKIAHIPSLYTMAGFLIQTYIMP